jgi:hypothetical protein
MRTRLGEAREGPNGTGNPVAPASAPVRLLPISAKIELSLSREIDDYAKAQGITRSRAAGHYLTIARETLRSREGVAAGKAEEILEALEGVRTIVELLGPPAFGLIRLLAHWGPRRAAALGSPKTSCSPSYAQ